jgi:uncharacterized protein (TIGR01777 family)
VRVIITGGTGLIGRSLAADLAADGHSVIVLSRSPERAQPPEGVTVAAWDARSADGWGYLVEGSDGIVNLAGESLLGYWTGAKKRRILRSRLDSAAAVVEAVEAARAKPRVLIQASATGYYGPRGSEIVREDTPPGTGFLAGIAVEWEASTAPVEPMGVRRVIIRTGTVLSTEGGGLPLLMLPFRFFVGGPLGGGQQWMPWIHVTDEVRAIRFLLLDNGASGPFNVAAPNPLTNAEFARDLGRAAGRPSLLPVPAFALRLVLGEMSSVVLNGQRAVPGRLLEQGFAFRFPRAAGALEDLLDR